ncbi:MAG: TlpA family protein disulfide reductase [Planctomycetes bacterium]|nr:TlpA family protein disulfide reductase [Planctomycetota bacterium]
MPTLAITVPLVAALLVVEADLRAVPLLPHPLPGAVVCRHQDPNALGIEHRMRALYDAHRADAQSASTKARLVAFWTANDAANAANPAYLLEKSTILGWMDEDDEAARVFRLVPDAALVTPHQLLQRIREIFDESPERTLPLVLRLTRADGDKASAWLHESYAQRCAPRPRDGLDPITERTWLASFAAPESEARPMVQGLLTWLDALSGDDTPEHLRTLLARPMGDDAARGPRYRLLLLERALRHHALRVEVRTSLESLVETLAAELRQLDKTSSASQRARLRYHLAHACHLFASRFCADDRERRIEWLQRTAQWAPDAADQEAAPALFYERVCLDGAQDHRSLCATELGHLGRTDEAVRLWLEQVLVSPDRLPEVRREILRLDARADFDALLHALFEEQLPLADDLELASLDGSTIRLGSYRGRWLLLDFWGTWCAPCRRELPLLAALDHDVRAHASERAAVLTVACNDTAATLRTFLARHGYDFPVVLGDDAVTNAFAVAGYPTKVLITPTGRWMKLAYGRVDWNAVARQRMRLP